MKAKKAITLAVSYTAAIVVVLSGFIYKNYTQTELYRRRVDNTYQHAFAELVNSVEGLDVSLQKSLYATSPSMINAVCTEIYGKSTAAVMAMGELPFESSELEHTAAFVSKIGDYAFSLSRNAAAGKGYTDDDRENLASLSKSASALSSNLTELYARLNSGEITMYDLDRSGEEISENEDGLVPTSLAGSIREIESDFPEIPALIYDGPFSAHISGLKPKLLEKAKTVSEKEAAERAAEFLGIDAGRLKLTGTRSDEVPVYIFSADSRNDRTRIIEVTVLGGEILNIAGSRYVGEASMSDDEAAKIAANFLKKRGYDSMKETYRYSADDAVTINYAYSQDGVTCYPDLVKVRVAKDNGEIINFESLGYVMNHAERDIPETSVSKDEAKAKVSDRLTVLSHSMAFIPTTGKNEKFCHEFKCKNESGQHYIIYVSPETGVEESILILLESERGTLAM